MALSEKINAEKRSHIRYVLEATARFTLESGAEISGAVENISVGGIFLLTDHPVTEDKTNVLGIVVIGAFINDLEVTVEAQSRIAHVTPKGVGIFYQSMDNSNRKSLGSIVKELRRLSEWT